MMIPTWAIALTLAAIFFTAGFGVGYNRGTNESQIIINLYRERLDLVTKLLKESHHD